MAAHRRLGPVYLLALIAAQSILVAGVAAVRAWPRSSACCTAAHAALLSYLDEFRAVRIYQRWGASLTGGKLCLCRKPASLKPAARCWPGTHTQARRACPPCMAGTHQKVHALGMHCLCCGL